MDESQIATLISDLRRESSYSTQDEQGNRVTVSLVDFATIDDFMLQGMKNVAYLLKFPTAEYRALGSSRDAITQLVRSHPPITGG